MNALVRFVARRVATLHATQLVSCFVIYGALDLAPGSPLAALTGGRTPSPEAIALLNARYHLSDPFLVRYWEWLRGAVTGDLGVSIPLHQDVSTLISERIGTTLALVAYASVIIVVVGIGLGVLAALRPGGVDTGVLVVTTISAALPSFVAAIALIFVFPLTLGVFPSVGSGQGFVDSIYHLTLPSIALATSSIALVARITRASVKSELGREHVQTAISRAIPTPLVVRRHVLRNAAIPITTIVGLTIASLIALAAIVERAFDINGLGAYLVTAALSKDFAVVQGISLVLVCAFVVTNMIVDLAYAVLDPRVTLGSRAQ